MWIVAVILSLSSYVKPGSTRVPVCSFWNSFSLDFVVIPPFNRYTIGRLRIFFPFQDQLWHYMKYYYQSWQYRINQESKIIIDRITADHIIIIICYIHQLQFGQAPIKDY